MLHVQAVVDGDREKDGVRAACENAVEQARKKRDRTPQHHSKQYKFIPYLSWTLTP